MLTRSSNWEVHAWYAVHTHPRQEDRADSNLRAWGIETFTPRIKRYRYNQSTSETIYQIKPLFPRYMFARFKLAELYYKIRFTRGVHSLVTFGNRPSVVEDEIIMAIKSRLGDDGLVATYEKLIAGDKVTIKEGPLKDFVAVFERGVSNSDRVRILLGAINYQAHLVIERHRIDKLVPGVSLE